MNWAVPKNIILPGEKVLWSNYEGDPVPRSENATVIVRTLSVGWIVYAWWRIFRDLAKHPENAFSIILPYLVGIVLGLVIIWFAPKFSKLFSRVEFTKPFKNCIITKQRILLFNSPAIDLVAISRSDLISTDEDFVQGSRSLVFRDGAKDQSFAFLSSQDFEAIKSILSNQSIIS